MKDAIVDEIRAIRDEIAREDQYDLNAIFSTLRRLEAESGHSHVTLPPRAPGADDGVRELDEEQFE